MTTARLDRYGRAVVRVRELAMAAGVALAVVVGAAGSTPGAGSAAAPRGATQAGPTVTATPAARRTASAPTPTTAPTPTPTPTATATAEPTPTPTAAAPGPAAGPGPSAVRGDGAPDGTVKVVGDGTPASCTSQALATAVRSGGVISFSCGPAPVTIVVAETLYTCNTTTCQHPWISGEPVTAMSLDGGGLVTLSGGGVRGIFYANACEEQFGWLTSACQDDTRPHVTFRNLTFADGNAQGAPAGFSGVGGGEGGGAIAMRAGTLTLSGVTFRNNQCMAAQSDGGGGAVRVVGMRNAVTISGSRFEGNRCANGGAISSLQAPLVITDSQITGNAATGHGASDGNGGNGGGIYVDGTSQTVLVARTTISGNTAPEGGPGIFFVSNDRTGTLTIDASTITGNTGQSFFTDPYRSIFYLGNGPIGVTGSTIE